MALFQLAQVNVARMIAPLDSPAMAGFVAQLATVNGVAEQFPGFVWRLKTGEGFNDPDVVVNLSVWESVEALRQFTYESMHSGPLRQRVEWFVKPKEHSFALWWIPAGHIPSEQEAWERLEHRRLHGDTPAAFSFAKTFPPEPAEVSAGKPASIGG